MDASIDSRHSILVDLNYYPLPLMYKNGPRAVYAIS